MSTASAPSVGVLSDAIGPEQYELLAREIAVSSEEREARLAVGPNDAIVDGTLIIGSVALLFCTSGALQKRTLKMCVPLGAIEQYARVHEKAQSAQQHHVSLTFQCRRNDVQERVTVRLLAGANSSYPDVITSCITSFIDVAVLAWQRQRFQAQTRLPPSGASNDTTLVVDERATRVVNSASSAQIFIAGTRFVGQCAFGLHGARPTDTTPMTPCLCCVSAQGLCVLLPMQRLLMPVYYNELNDVVGTGHTLSFQMIFEHQARPFSHYWLMRLAAPAKSLQRSMERATEHAFAADAKPFPKTYPPPRAFGVDGSLELPVAPRGEAEIGQRDHAVAALQAELGEQARRDKRDRLELAGLTTGEPAMIAVPAAANKQHTAPGLQQAHPLPQHGRRMKRVYHQSGCTAISCRGCTDPYDMVLPDGRDRPKPARAHTVWDKWLSPKEVYHKAGCEKISCYGCY